jgi:hypothetical protein
MKKSNKAQLRTYQSLSARTNHDKTGQTVTQLLHLLHELQIVTSEKVAKDWVFSMPGFVGHRDGRNEIWIATN